MPKQISIVSSNKNTYKEKCLIKQLCEAQVNPKLSSKMKQELINVLYKYKNAFALNYEPLGTFIGHEVDITLNIDRPYPPVLTRPDYPESTRAREALENVSKSL
ncbi:hypothetical protein O181_002698 [Austropuccinia psidii MF-1]|uniref:Uncharacterized protein n=1 Tax=Austropuccinia psidii MF-1 TaxID=1389203 RepID=A0A9Q3GCV5_9BASI|nr:hypothetical protein [Austropuccinia psidii MF-1]